LTGELGERHNAEPKSLPEEHELRHRSDSV
jgi:hypothetical protein